MFHPAIVDNENVIQHMPATKPQKSTKQPTTRRRSVSLKKIEQASMPILFRKAPWMWVKHRAAQVHARHRAFLLRRPHRSFRRTLSRDYRRKLTLPGYHAFTLYVFGRIRAHWHTFLLLVAVYAALMVVLGGITSQDTYTQISNLLKQSTSTLTSGGIDALGQAGLLLVATFASGPSNLTTDQQIYLTIILLFVWLTTVWLLREYMLARKPKLRDGLYNAGSPFISTLLVLLVAVCQLLPLGIVALIYAALSSVGLISSGFGSMIFWVFAVIVAALVLYWTTSTFIALVVVTLPGMYPRRAMRAAGDLVVGRRLRIMYRILWCFGTIIIGWAIVMIPLILFDTWVKSIWQAVASVPLMPIAAACMSALTIVWLASYIYLLYRKVVDDVAPPA